MSTEIVDLSAVLKQLELSEQVPLQHRAIGQHQDASWAVVRLQPDASWDLPNASECLITDGYATFTVGDQRHSVGPGHLLLSPTGGSLTNDGTLVFQLLHRVPTLIT